MSNVGRIEIVEIGENRRRRRWRWGEISFAEKSVNLVRKITEPMSRHVSGWKVGAGKSGKRSRGFDKITKQRYRSPLSILLSSHFYGGQDWVAVNRKWFHWWARTRRSCACERMKKKYCPKVDKIDRSNNEPELVEVEANSCLEQINKTAAFSSSLSSTRSHSSARSWFAFAGRKIIKPKEKRWENVSSPFPFAASVYKTRKKCVKIFSLISEIRFNWTNAN